jgi:hypothetical protein
LAGADVLAISTSRFGIIAVSDGLLNVCIGWTNPRGDHADRKGSDGLWRSLTDRDVRDFLNIRN